MSKTTKLTVRTETREIWVISRRTTREIVYAGPHSDDRSTDQDNDHLLKELEHDHENDTLRDIGSNDS